jgi:hypothetical protein
MPIDWIAFASLILSTIVTIIGGVSFYFRATATELKEIETEAERRHLETVQRLVRLETLVIKGNGLKH